MKRDRNRIDLVLTLKCHCVFAHEKHPRGIISKKKQLLLLLLG